MARLKSVKLTLDRFDEARRAIRRAVEEALEESADEIVEEARQKAPVSTGRLRDSIKAQRR
jgi:hypothetical protein